MGLYEDKPKKSKKAKTTKPKKGKNEFVYPEPTATQFRIIPGGDQPAPYIDPMFALAQNVMRQTDKILAPSPKPYDDLMKICEAGSFADDNGWDDVAGRCRDVAMAMADEIADVWEAKIGAKDEGEVERARDSVHKNGAAAPSFDDVIGESPPAIGEEQVTEEVDDLGLPPGGDA